MAHVHGLPWWRVIQAGGTVAGAVAVEQARLLRRKALRSSDGGSSRGRRKADLLRAGGKVVARDAVVRAWTGRCCGRALGTTLVRSFHFCIRSLVYKFLFGLTHSREG